LISGRDQGKRDLVVSDGRIAFIHKIGAGVLSRTDPDVMTRSPMAVSGWSTETERGGEIGRLVGWGVCQMLAS
jgi:hypothetical protein